MNTVLIIIVIGLVIIVTWQIIKSGKNTNQNQVYNTAQNTFISVVQAEKIVKDFGILLASRSENEPLFRPISALKNSVGEIKEAYKIYIKEIQDKDLLTVEMKFALIGTYCGLQFFVDDNMAKLLNKYHNIPKQINDPLEEKIYNEYFKKTMANFVSLDLEINELLK